MSPALGLRPRAGRRGHLTLRGRLLAVLLACLLFSCSAVAAATTLALRRFLLDRLDQQLGAAGDRYAVSLEHAGDGDPDDAAFQSVIGQPAGTLGARVLNGKVTALAVVGSSSPPGSAQTRAAIAQLGPTRSPRTIHVPDLGEFRILVSVGRDGDLLITGLPEHSVDETITHLLEIEAVVFAAALLVSAIAGAVFVRISLRPLTRVAHTALQVSELPLASGTVSIPERVDNPAPGTEVGQVADAFNHMLEHVESALTVRQQGEDQLRRFIADASHELRTPVAVIRSHAEYAQRVGGGALAEDVEHALGRIAAESGRMSMLIDDLLLLARLDSGRGLAREPVDLTRLTLDATRDAQAAGPEHHWRLELPDEPVTVSGDEHALHQVLANLLANARVHTPPGTTVTVEIAPGASQAGPVLIVTDDGPGIAAGLQPHIFERLVHGGDAARSTSGGSGLGLSIVEAIVHAHGGRIEVDSVPGRTQFRIELPR
ncbi:MAG: HAMP domain-containing histidine kinase [Actinomycetota bacterium]|nr:HAMP domain-containing histidine kinase [Actinomycetota bacterium]